MRQREMHVANWTCRIECLPYCNGHGDTTSQHPPGKREIDFGTDRIGTWAFVGSVCLRWR